VRDRERASAGPAAECRTGLRGSAEDHPEPAYLYSMRRWRPPAGEMRIFGARRARSLADPVILRHQRSSRVARRIAWARFEIRSCGAHGRSSSAVLGPGVSSAPQPVAAGCAISWVLVGFWWSVDLSGLASRLSCSAILLPELQFPGRRFCISDAVPGSAACPMSALPAARRQDAWTARAGPACWPSWRCDGLDVWRGL
jgi:hypothetical protein